jgi:hypothetical protein
MTRKSMKLWNITAFLPGKQPRNIAYAKPSVRFWLASPPPLLGNQKLPFLLVIEK